MNTEATLLVDIDDGVATLTLNRPRQKNAMNRAMFAALRDAIYAIRAGRDFARRRHGLLFRRRRAWDGRARRTHRA
jgi:hypothetical protein